MECLSSSQKWLWEACGRWQGWSVSNTNTDETLLLQKLGQGPPSQSGHNFSHLKWGNVKRMQQVTLTHLGRCVKEPLPHHMLKHRQPCWKATLGHSVWELEQIPILLWHDWKPQNTLWSLPLHICFEKMVEGVQHCGEIQDNFAIVIHQAQKWTEFTDIFWGWGLDNYVNLVWSADSTGINLVSQEFNGWHAHSLWSTRSTMPCLSLWLRSQPMAPALIQLNL